MLCSAIKLLGSGRAHKKYYVSCFPLHFVRALLLPACFTTEQSTVEEGGSKQFQALSKT